MTNPLENLGFIPKNTKEGRNEEEKRNRKKGKKSSSDFSVGGCLKLFGSVVGCILLFSFIIVAQTVVYSFTFFVLWEWFIVPLGVTAISIWHAAGLTLFSNFAMVCIAKRDYSKEMEDKSKVGIAIWLFVNIIIIPAIFLLSGGLFKFLM